MEQIIRASPVLAAALLRTIELSFATILLASVVGTALGELAGISGRAVNWIISRYVDVVRGIPLLVFIFLVYYLLPVMGLRLESTTSAVVALAAYFSGYVAEIIRAARQSIPKGQIQSGLALGMTRLAVERIVIAPQALRIAIPGLVNLSSIAIKGTSLVSIIGVWELTSATREIVMRTVMPFQFFLVLMAIHFVVCFSIVSFSRLLERRLAVAFA